MTCACSNTSEVKNSRGHCCVCNTNKRSYRTNANLECLNTNQVIRHFSNIKWSVISNTISRRTCWVCGDNDRVSIAIVIQDDFTSLKTVIRNEESSVVYKYLSNTGTSIREEDGRTNTSSSEGSDT